AGRQLFAGATVSDTLAAVLKEEPDWEALPPRLRTLVRSCLEKDPRRRMRDIGDARILMDVAPAQPAPGPLLPWAVAGLAVLIAGAGLWGWLRPKRAETPLVMRFVSPISAGQAGITTPAGNIAVSPDGARIAFVAGPRSEIYVRAMDQFQAKLLPGTE